MAIEDEVLEAEVATKEPTTIAMYKISEEEDLADSEEEEDMWIVIST